MKIDCNNCDRHFTWAPAQNTLALLAERKVSVEESNSRPKSCGVCRSAKKRESRNDG